MMRVDATSSREIQATIFSISRAGKELQGIIRRETKKVAEPEFRKALIEHAETPMEHRGIVGTLQTVVSNQNLTVKVGGKRAKFSGGFDVKRSIRALEFGANREKVVKYTNRKGTPVSRRTMRGFRPPRRNGYVFFPSVRQMAPRIVALWVQTTVRQFHEAAERR